MKRKHLFKKTLAFHTHHIHCNACFPRRHGLACFSEGLPSFSVFHKVLANFLLLQIFFSVFLDKLPRISSIRHIPCQKLSSILSTEASHGNLLFSKQSLVVFNYSLVPIVPRYAAKILSSGLTFI